MVIILLVAVDDIKQLKLLVNITLTWSLLLRALVVNAILFAPAFTLLTCHWYDGLVPLFTGMAVNVTAVPEHILAEEVFIVTAGTWG